MRYTIKKYLTTLGVVSITFVAGLGGVNAESVNGTKVKTEYSETKLKLEVSRRRLAALRIATSSIAKEKTKAILTLGRLQSIDPRIDDFTLPPNVQFALICNDNQSVCTCDTEASCKAMKTLCTDNTVGSDSSWGVGEGCSG